MWTYLYDDPTLQHIPVFYCHCNKKKTKLILSYKQELIEKSSSFTCVCITFIIFLTDTKKMPLGKLSKSQIAKGFEVLEEMEAAMKKKKTSGLMELSSQFYTIIPHNFGRQRPPVISTLETVRHKLDMLTVRTVYNKAVVCVLPQFHSDRE